MVSKISIFRKLCCSKINKYDFCREILSALYLWSIGIKMHQVSMPGASFTKIRFLVVLKEKLCSTNVSDYFQKYHKFQYSYTKKQHWTFKCMCKEGLILIPFLILWINIFMIILFFFTFNPKDNNLKIINFQISVNIIYNQTYIRISFSLYNAFKTNLC